MQDDSNLLNCSKCSKIIHLSCTNLKFISSEYLCSLCDCTLKDADALKNSRARKSCGKKRSGSQHNINSKTRKIESDCMSSKDSISNPSNLSSTPVKQKISHVSPETPLNDTNQNCPFDESIDESSSHDIKSERSGNFRGRGTSRGRGSRSRIKDGKTPNVHQRRIADTAAFESAGDGRKLPGSAAKSRSKVKSSASR